MRRLLPAVIDGQPALRRVGENERVSRMLTAGIAVAFAASLVAVVGLWIALAGDDAQAVPAERPSHFVTRTLATLARDDYVRAWDSLYPPHQEVAPREEYVACEMKTPLAWKIR